MESFLKLTYKTRIKAENAGPAASLGREQSMFQVEYLLSELGRREKQRVKLHVRWGLNCKPTYLVNE